MSNTKVVTNPVEVSYPHLTEPFASVEGAKAKYSVTILIDKSNKALLDKIDKAIDNAIQDAITKKFNGKAPNKNNLRLPLKDGDDRDAKEFKGKYYINCTWSFTSSFSSSSRSSNSYCTWINTKFLFH